MNAHARLFAATIVFLLASVAAHAATVPVITSISPANVYLNGPAFTLTVNGTGFAAGDTVYLAYGTPLTTTYVSSTKLTAGVPASYLTGADTFAVYVDNSSNQQSNTEPLSIIDPTPTLQSISPSSVVAASAPSPLAVSGSSFMTGATVEWNGKTLPTTYINSGELQFTPTKFQLANASIASIAVKNPSPGTVSGSQTFDVTYPALATTIDLPANDIVWDPYAQLIYASMPSSYGANGNSIAVINPANGKIIGYHFVGSEPTQLALSSDSQYLYVGLNGNGSVQRLILPNFTPDIDVPLATQSGGLNIAGLIAVSPSDDHTWAVAIESPNCCGQAGLYFYQDGTQLAFSIDTYPYLYDFVWVNSTTMYAYSDGSVIQITVNSSGGSVTQVWIGDIDGSSISYAAGLIYGNDGKVFNPATGFLLGSYDLGTFCCNNTYPPILPDAPINRFFALTQTPFFNGFGITAYNLTEFTPIAVTNLSQLSENSTPTASAFIPWGSNGAAFLVQSPCCGSVPPQLELVRSPAMFLTSSTAANPVPNAKSLSPSSATHGGWNLPVTITGTGFAPGSTVTWNGAQLYAAYISSTQLTLYVPYSDIAAAGTAQVVVSNPAPGGGKAAPLTFTIN
jgi:trimeric autotransporter adhesin